MLKKSLLFTCLLINTNTYTMFQKTVIALTCAKKPIDMIKVAGYLTGRGYCIIEYNKTEIKAEKSPFGFGNHTNKVLTVKFKPNNLGNYEVHREDREMVSMPSPTDKDGNRYDVACFCQKAESRLMKSATTKNLFDVIDQVDKFDL